MRIALDTKAYSALMQGHRDVAALVRRSEAVLVPAVVVGELLSSDSHFGAVDGFAWLPFSPAEEDSVREQVWRYHTDPGR